MSNINLYNLSNKIRTNLLITVDKEILNNSKKNHLLINSQNQEQLTRKFENYRDFVIECSESFEGVQNNEDNNVFSDVRYNHSDSKFSFTSNSSKTNKEYLFNKNFITKSYSPKKNIVNTKIKKIKNSKISENNLCKLQIDSGKTLTSETESSFSCRETLDLKNSLSLSNDNNNQKYKKKFSVDLFNYSVHNKNNDSSKLINYCYKLKKPNDEIINEISEDDTLTNKEIKKNYISPHKIKSKHKSIPKKKLKKIINKKKNYNKNIHNYEDRPLVFPIKKNTTNFTNEMELYFEYTETPYTKEKIKIPYTDKKLLNIGSKEIDNFHSKNSIQLRHCNFKSPEKKSKRKKFESPTKSLLCNLLINKNTANKKLRHFKSIDNNHLILKQKEKREKREKKEKKEGSIDVIVFCNKHSRRKNFKSSKLVYKKNDEFR